MPVLSIAAQTISGTVTDAQNAPVENAETYLTNKNKVISRATTDAGGEFSLATNGEQNLFLRVSAKGFAAFEKQLNESDLRVPLTITLQTQNLREEVSVSITRTESRLSEAPASVVVLNRETLEKTAAQTVDDALRQIPGFTLFRRSSSRTTNPTTQGAALRGIGGSGASRASVLLDGVSLNDAFGGWTYWSRVPRAAIEQIETLRGGASALYGSGALSGAINVLTKDARDAPVFGFETSLGTQGTVDGSLFTAFGKNGWNLILAAESFRTNGYIPVDEEERGAADAEANSRHHNLLATLERRFNPNTRIFLRGNVFKERRENGTRLQNNETYFRQAAAGADWNNRRFGTFNFRVSVETQAYDQTFSAISADRNTENLTRAQRVPSQAFAANGFWSRGFENHTLSGAIEARRVRGASDETIYGNGNPTSLVGAGGRGSEFGFFAQDFWRVNGKLNLNFGARFDRWRNERGYSITRSLTTNQTTVTNFPDRAETAFSPRVAAIYQANQNLSFFASVGKSFRAPTLNELYRAFRVGNVLTVANENLRAERATSFETGASFSAARRFNLRATGFWTEVAQPVSNVTLVVAPNLITRQRQNLGQTRSRGAEIDAELDMRRDLKLSAGYLFVDARIANFPANTNLNGKFLPQVARHQLTFQAFYRPGAPFSLGLQGRLSGRQFEDDQNQLELRRFFTLDVFAAYRLPKKMEIFVAVENVFDNRYDIGRTPARTIAAPRFVRLGLRRR